jgi:hypothetical protein
MNLASHQNSKLKKSPLNNYNFQQPSEIKINYLNGTENILKSYIAPITEPMGQSIHSEDKLQSVEGNYLLLSDLYNIFVRTNVPEVKIFTEELLRGASNLDPEIFRLIWTNQRYTPFFDTPHSITEHSYSEIYFEDKIYLSNLFLYTPIFPKDYQLYPLGLKNVPTELIGDKLSFNIYVLKSGDISEFIQWGKNLELKSSQKKTVDSSLVNLKRCLDKEKISIDDQLFSNEENILKPINYKDLEKKIYYGTTTLQNCKITTRKLMKIINFFYKEILNFYIGFSDGKFAMEYHENCISIIRYLNSKNMTSSDSDLIEYKNLFSRFETKIIYNFFQQIESLFKSEYIEIDFYDMKTFSDEIFTNLFKIVSDEFCLIQQIVRKIHSATDSIQWRDIFKAVVNSRSSEDYDKNSDDFIPNNIDHYTIDAQWTNFGRLNCDSDTLTMIKSKSDENKINGIYYLFQLIQ